MNVQCICGAKMVRRMRLARDRFVKYRYVCTNHDCDWVLKVRTQPTLGKAALAKMGLLGIGIGIGKTTQYELQKSDISTYWIADGELFSQTGKEHTISQVGALSQTIRLSEKLFSVTGKMNPKRAMQWFAKASKLKAFL